LGGGAESRLHKMSDVFVRVPSDDPGLIESAHLVVDHCLTRMLYERGIREPDRPVVLLDRDGVIIRNHTDHVRDWSEVEILPGALEALSLFAERGHRVFVVTNQSAVGRGLMSLDDVTTIHDMLAQQVIDSGGRIEAFLVCPHAPEAGCDCRKPAPGLLFQARDRFNLDLASSYFIGDHETDLMAAAAAGCTGILVLSGRSQHGYPTGEAPHIADDLLAAARIVTGDEMLVRT
jgi:D-glycero-D-manno-heptose 1,7-bisphosphate phosphatase